MSFVVHLLNDSGGVVHYTDDSIRRPVIVRVREAADGRLEVAEVYLPPEAGPVTSDHLRQIPVARIEAHVNQPERRAVVIDSLRPDAPRLPLEVAAFRYMSEAMEGTEAPTRRRRSLRLVLPTTRRYPDSFYSGLAALYSGLAGEGRRPAAAIAEANGIPVSQVHRWVKEARRRGLLAPGRSGKAG